MRWSKLKQLVENSFAGSLKRRLALHSAAYGACTCGHAWITLDGEVIANFCTRAFYNRFVYGQRSRDQGITEEQKKRYADQFVEYGDMGRQEFYDLCWSFAHDLNINDALRSDNALIQALAVVDKRLGKRRLETLDPADLHPLAAKLLDVRKGVEVRHGDSSPVFHNSAVTPALLHP